MPAGGTIAFLVAETGQPERIMFGAIFAKLVDHQRRRNRPLAWRGCSAVTNARVPREVRRAGLAIRRLPRGVDRRPAPSPAYWATLRTFWVRRNAA